MRIRIPITLTATVAAGVFGAGSAVALPPFNTAPKTGPSTGLGDLAAVTVGRHPTFDRVVFRWSGASPGFSVRYVPRIFQDGSGLPVPLLGTRFLAIRFEPTLNGGTFGVARTLTPRFPTLRQVKFAGDFEGVVNYGAGVSRRVGFRVFTLTNPRRTVIDVLH